MLRYLRFWLFIALMFVGIPAITSAATYAVDLGVRAADITFDPATFVVGQTVRVYATVHNFGTTDTRGSVLFFQGAIPIGEEQIISARAGGFADEVFADFIVPNGTFNILVRIRGTSPADQNTANDEALTPLVTPINDTDRDGISDEKDNCLKAANADQLDTDRDGIGNACDTDDDNDGLSDSEEAAGGTNPLNPDSDGDGVTDSKDIYPLDSKRSKVAVVVPSPVQTTKPSPAPTPEKKDALNRVAVVEAKETKETQRIGTVRSDSGVTSTNEISSDGLKPSALYAAITSERKTWNTFAFTATGVGAPKNAQYFWEFGDGGGAEGTEVSHTYKSTGDYTTVLTIKDGKNQVMRDTVPVSVSFWNFANPRVWVLVSLLGVVIVWMLGVLLRK